MNERAGCYILGETFHDVNATESKIRQLFLPASASHVPLLINGLYFKLRSQVMSVLNSRTVYEDRRKSPCTFYVNDMMVGLETTR